VLSVLRQAALKRHGRHERFDAAGNGRHEDGIRTDNTNRHDRNARRFGDRRRANFDAAPDVDGETQWLALYAPWRSVRQYRKYIWTSVRGATNKCEYTIITKIKSFHKFRRADRDCGIQDCAAFNAGNSASAIKISAVATTAGWQLWGMGISRSNMLLPTT